MSESIHSPIYIILLYRPIVMKVFAFSLVALVLVAAPVLASSAAKSQPSSHPSSSCKDFECPPHDRSGRSRWNAGEYSDDSLNCKYQTGKGTVYSCEYNSHGKWSGGVSSCPYKGLRRGKDVHPSSPTPSGKWNNGRGFIAD